MAATLPSRAAAAGQEEVFPEHVGAFGPLLVHVGDAGDATSGGGMRGGFSARRWIWWLRCLDEIASLANETGEDAPSFGSLVHGMMDNMMLVAQQTNGPVRKALQQPGGLVSHRPRVQLLGRGRPATAGTPH